MNRIFCLLLYFLFLLSFDTYGQGAKASQVSTKKSLNPDISVNFLSSYKNSKRQGDNHSDENSGFALDEVELQFLADVDPYLRATATFSVHPVEEVTSMVPEEGAPVGATDEEMSDAPATPPEKSWGAEPEEVYVETTQLPYIMLKLGRFHAALGHHNTLHAHAYPFLDAPLINQKLLGDEGLVETGLSLSALLPLPWFSEVTAQGLQGDSPLLFSSSSSSDLASVYRLRNLFDINDETTFDLGLSGAQGANYFSEHTYIHGADISLKWRPSEGGKYRALIVAAEYLSGTINGRLEEKELEGYVAWIQYQFSERWWVQMRSEEVNNREKNGAITQKISALVGFFPSEFSGIRLQYDQTHDALDKPLESIALQGIITIGAHPAHAY